MQQKRCHAVVSAKRVQSTACPSRAQTGILVVDDDHAVRASLRLGLSLYGFTVWLAASGREAIDFYRVHGDRVSVVLLNVCMPELDGLRTLDALREFNREVRACFMSSDTYGFHAEELLKRRTARFIPKPFRLGDLAKLLRLLSRSAGDQKMAPVA